MTDEQVIHVLEVNHDANLSRPKFVEACDTAIVAIRENRQLKNRCFVLSRGTLCMWCGMKCDALGKPKGEGEQE